MKKQESRLQTNTAPDWKEVLVEIVLKILTLGLYHVERKMKSERDQPNMADAN